MVDATPKKKGKLPEHLEDRRTRVSVGRDSVTNTETGEYGGTYASLGVDSFYTLEGFRRDFRIEVASIEGHTMVIHLIGIDAPIANALRRILIAEVPTMAIEQVFLFNNTGVMQDEVLAHRLGLIPIFADPRNFNTKNENDDPTDCDTLVFRLKATPPPNIAPDQNWSVLSSDLTWIPNGEQVSIPLDEQPRVVENNILITTLRPGQEIDLEAHASKGIGRDHAKWSPVATASYRLLPEIIIKTPVTGEMADELVQLCPMKVFDIEDLADGSRQAKVVEPRNCTMCRECIRDDKWQPHVRLARKKDHFIFSIESTGALTPEVLFSEALKILQGKCQMVLEQIQFAEQSMVAREEEEVAEEMDE